VTSTLTPATDNSRTLREFDSYDEAQALVDRLADAGFPVERVRIVGTGIRVVEQGADRMTGRRAAGAGAIAGAWFALLVTVLLGLAGLGPAWPAVLVASPVIGALWGAAFGAVVHRVARGRRGFAGGRDVQADRYAVEVQDGYVDQAARLAGIA
jgi:hypothetical protein